MITTLAQLKTAYANKISTTFYGPSISLYAYPFNANKVVQFIFNSKPASVMPAPATHASGGTTYINGSAGFIKHPGAATTYIAGVDFFDSSQLSLSFHDRLWSGSGVSMLVTTSQAFTTGTIPRNVNNYIDLEWYLEISTAYSGSQTVATITYTNTNNVSKQTSVTIPTNAPAGSLHRITPGNMALADFKDNIKSITAIQLSVAGTAGDIAVTVIRRLANFGNQSYNIGGYKLPNNQQCRQDWMALGLPKLEIDTCLGIELFCSSSTGVFSGTIDFIVG